MVIKKIHIENYRAYKHFDCEFEDGLNLVIGDNGAGKTSLLSAVTQLLSAQLNSFGGTLQLDPADPHIEVERAGDATLSVKECFPIKLNGEIETPDAQNYEFEIYRQDYSNTSFSGNVDVLKKQVEYGDGIWPLISYQRFDREWKIGKNTGKTVEVSTGLNDRKDGYSECLRGIGQDDKIQKWCLKMSMLEFERKSTIKEFERFKHIIKRFLQIIEETEEDFEVNYSVGFSGLVMKKGDMVQPLFELSTGYKAILSMIMELAYRAVLLNPTLQIDDIEQPGIVIIDEIDAHLHPKWQWKVIDALTACFPKVQFIIATHSPIVIASAKEARLINLDEKGQVSYLDGAYGYNVADVLDLKQGSLAMPKVSSEFMNKLEDALNDGNLSEANKVVLDAGREFGEESPIYNELKDHFEINRWVENN